VGIAIYVGVAALLGLILAIVGVLAATHQ